MEHDLLQLEEALNDFSLFVTCVTYFSLFCLAVLTLCSVLILRYLAKIHASLSDLPAPVALERSFPVKKGLYGVPDAD